MTKNLTILYFAALREAAGKERETRTTPAATPAALYAELQTEYALPLPQSRLRAARNHTFCEWDTPRADGDTITFIPPVAGG